MEYQDNQEENNSSEKKYTNEELYDMNYQKYNNGGNSYNNDDHNNGSADYGLATASMVCGILSIVLLCCSGLFSIVLGIIAIVLSAKFRKSNNRMSTPASLTGMICGIIGLSISVLSLAYAIYFYNVHYEEFMDMYNKIFDAINKRG